MQHPELDEQVIEVLPFWKDSPYNLRIFVGNVALMDGDPFEILGLDGLEHGGNPPNARPSRMKLHGFEFGGLGEVGQDW